MEAGDLRHGPFGKQLSLAVDTLRGVRAKRCVDCKLTTFKNIGAFDADGKPVHNFEQALRDGLLRCSRPNLECVNPLPELDTYSAFVLRFFLDDRVQAQWPHGLGIPNGLPRPGVIAEASASGIEWSEHFSQKFAVCERAYLDALRELKDE